MKITQHVRDLFKVKNGGDSTGIVEVNQHAAIRWFFHESDIDFWCELAGYDENKVRLAMKRAYLQYKDGTNDIIKRMSKKLPGEGSRYEERKRRRNRLKDVAS